MSWLGRNCLRLGTKSYGKKFEKVICIGLPKTGTTTLGKALEVLGYSKAPYDIDLIEKVANGSFDSIKNYIEIYDCFEAWPWPLVYKYVYNLEPNAAYILTVRKETDVWLDSLRRHTSRNPSIESKHLRKSFFRYDDPWRYGDEYKKFYEQHIESVDKFFRDKSNQFLSLCFENCDGWSELCQFLNTKIPEGVDFPHENSAKSRNKLGYKSKKQIRKIIKTIRNCF